MFYCMVVTNGDCAWPHPPLLLTMHFCVCVFCLPVDEKDEENGFCQSEEVKVFIPGAASSEAEHTEHTSVVRINKRVGSYPSQKWGKGCVGG